MELTDEPGFDATTPHDLFLLEYWQQQLAESFGRGSLVELIKLYRLVDVACFRAPTPDALSLRARINAAGSSLTPIWSDLLFGVDTFASVQFSKVYRPNYSALGPRLLDKAVAWLRIQAALAEPHAASDSLEQRRSELENTIPHHQSEHFWTFVFLLKNPDVCSGLTALTALYGEDT